MASSATRGSLWSDSASEVRALIAIWGESDIQDELDRAVRNKVVFEEIAKKLVLYTSVFFQVFFLFYFYIDPNLWCTLALVVEYYDSMYSSVS